MLLMSVAMAHAQQSGEPGSGAARIVALDPRWTVSFEASPAAPVGFDQQMAYVALESGELVAVDLDGGHVSWHVELATMFTPATGDGLVFVAAADSVVALEQLTGRTLWRTPVGGALSGPVHWDGGWLLASTETGDLIALDAANGRERWRVAVGAPLAVAPTASGERIYVALRHQHIAALDLDAGQVVWTTPVASTITGLLALDNQLLAGSRANVLHSISLDDGRIRWTQRAGADIVGAPAADDELIYFAALDNVLRALDRGSGNLEWRRNLPSRPRGGPLRAENIVFVPLMTTDVVAYQAETGAEAFTIHAVGELGGVPFLRDNPRPTAPRLIAVSREGALQGFAPRIEPPPVPLVELPGVRVGG